MSNGFTMKEIKDEVRTMEQVTKEEKIKSTFDILNAINVNDHTEEKNGLTYLSWAWAWSELKKIYPDAQYTIERFGENKVPYLYDENLGYMVFTSMTVNGLTHEMWLPVMDGANKAMKDKPYTYKVRKWNNTTRKYEVLDKLVEAATMFDINKTIMRCLVKNIGMFGLGIYIYAGEDLPQNEDVNKEVETPQQEPPKQQKPQNKEPKKQPKSDNPTEKTMNMVNQKLVEAKNAGIELTEPKVIDFIKKNNNGKHQIYDMTESELQNYIKVLNTLIKGKQQKGNK